MHALHANAAPPPQNPSLQDVCTSLPALAPLPCGEPAARALPLAGIGRVQLTLERSLQLGLEVLAQRSGTSVSTLLLAAWALVLSRHLRETRVLFATSQPVAAGPRLILAHLEHGRRLGGLLREIHDPPILPAIAGGGSEVLVTFDRGEHAEPLSDVALEVAFHITDTLRVVLRYQRSRLGEPAAARLAGALRAVLQQFRDQEQPLGEIEVLTAAQARQMLGIWNDTARPFSDQELLHEGFEAQVAVQPEACAVALDGNSLSYAELEVRANRLAHALRAAGARPGVFVGICVARSIELVVALLAVSKSGAAYVPLDPDYPTARLAAMVRDASVPLVVCDGPRKPWLAADVIMLDVHDAALAEQPSSRPRRISEAAEACYCIFTSGSTGTPNGVVLTHRAVLNTLDWVNRTFAVGPADRALFVTSPSFDLSVYDVFGVLGAGGTVVVASRDTLRDPALLFETLIEQRITLWNSAPAQLQQLAPWFARTAASGPLRLVFLSGDWIPLTLPAVVRDAFPGAAVVSLGGATECAIWSNYFRVEQVDPRWVSIPYGRPIQNARYHVLDDRMRPVPIGVVGDLYIGGACLAQGYLGKAELTRQRFVRDPFASDGEERLYRTGDLARYFEDGELELLGRSDAQCKIRGFRVELGEVEAGLRAVPGVREAVCTSPRDASGERSLVAYVVPEAERLLSESVVKRILSDKLPPFMIPAHVVFLPSLPLSANGKVDRTALLDPRLLAPESAAPDETLGERERQVVELWQRLLGRGQVGLDDDFFALGGHSLLALMFLHEARTRLGIDVSLSRFLERRTIAGFLAAADGSGLPLRRSPRLTSFQLAGRRPPLALFAGGPYTLLYRKLPPLLGPEQPVHLIEGALSCSRAWTAKRGGMCELVNELLELCPRNPLVLGAFGAKALAALELAHQLERRGRAVHSLILIDPCVANVAPRVAGLPWLTRALARPLPSLRSARRLSCEALVIRARDLRALGAHAPLDLAKYVAGPVSERAVPGDHMAFLAEEPRAGGVSEAIRMHLERCAPLAEKAG